MTVATTTKKAENAYTRLAKAMAELGPTAPKIGNNPHFNSGFCPLPELMKIVHPVLQSNDLILTQPLFQTGIQGTVGVGTELRCSLTGELLVRSELVMPCDATNPQKATSSVTYGRRTGVTSILGIAEADDDGNTASKKTPKKGGSAPAAGGSKDIW
jgi:hypothetical protein